MKNVAISLNSVMLPLSSSAPPFAKSDDNKITTFNLTIQFDDEAEALAFTRYMLDNIQKYKAGGV